MLPPASSLTAGDVVAWARCVVEARSLAAEWQYVIDSLQHEICYLRTRLNICTNGSDGLTGAAEDAVHLTSQLEVAQQHLQHALQAQHSADSAGLTESWVSSSAILHCTAEVLHQMVEDLVEELFFVKQQTCKAQQQLFQQQLMASSFALALQTYNACLGDLEQELCDAVAEIQVTWPL